MYDFVFLKTLEIILRPGIILDTWKALVVDDDGDSWDANLAQHIEVLIDDVIYVNQKDYIVETKKSANMTTKKMELTIKGR